MKIEFTNEEYEALMHLVYLGDWVLHATDEEHVHDLYCDLAQKIYREAKDHDCGDLVEHDEAGGHYGPSREFEESDVIREAIDEYDNETFWNELSSRLAIRDLVKKHGDQKMESMDGDDRLRMIWDAESPYQKEFEENGLERLHIRPDVVKGGQRRRR